MPPVIGIDLGTMNCCVAVLKDGKPTVIPDGEHPTIPSFIHQRRDGSYTVGHEAKKLAADEQDRTVYAIKRLIGRNYNTPEVERSKSYYPYSIVEGENYEVKVRIGNSALTPQLVSCELLKYMRQLASSYLNEEVTDAIVTVPAYFNNNQRKATKQAGELAGLNVLRLLNEPTAAALAYGFRRDMNKIIAVYDLGGGTFDVSILRISNNTFEVIGTNGDSYLGGVDFDTRIAEHLLKEYARRGGDVSKVDEAATHRLVYAAELLKCELSAADKVTFNLSSFFPGDNRIDPEITVHRSTVEDMVGDLLQRTLDICGKALSEIHLSPSQIDEVLLVGGQTRMPAVQRAASSFFGREPNRSVNPDEAVAMGASIQGALLGDIADDTLLLDVTPLSLGIATFGDNFSKIIEKNSKIPCSSTRTFRTVRDNQDHVRIVVRQGENEKASQNTLLAELTLTGIRRAKRLETKVDVTFRLDSDGILNITARDPDTGKENSVVVKDFLDSTSDGQTDAAYQSQAPATNS